MSPLPGDASARRYFRAAAGKQTWMAMHSPLSEKPEQFFAVGKFLSDGGLRAPAVVAAAPARGFFLLEDFGDNTYLSALQKLGERKRDELAGLAMDALVKMQTLTPPPGLLPIYDDELLTEEMNWYPQWYRSRHCGRPLGKKAQEVFARSADWLRLQMRRQPQVFTHRDYHSRNLMRIANGPGVLDFQDAVLGPAAYDLASFSRDAYWRWSDEQRERHLRRYRRAAAAAGMARSVDDIRRDVNVAAAQRGLKVLGIFARLRWRDNKPSYLSNMPLVYENLLSACRALPPLSGLAEVIEEAPPPCAR